jgi:hypothetical protein
LSSPDGEFRREKSSEILLNALHFAIQIAQTRAEEEKQQTAKRPAVNEIAGGGRGIRTPGTVSRTAVFKMDRLRGFPVVSRAWERQMGWKMGGQALIRQLLFPTLFPTISSANSQLV